MNQRVAASLPRLTSFNVLSNQATLFCRLLRHQQRLVVAPNQCQRRTLRTRQKPRVRTATADTDIDDGSVDSSEADYALDTFDRDLEVESPAKATKAQHFQTWQGLKRITTSEWDERNAQQYSGFNAPARETATAREIETSVRRALIEAFHLLQYGGPLREIQQGDNLLSAQQLSSATFLQKRGNIFLQYGGTNEPVLNRYEESEAQAVPQDEASGAEIDSATSIRWSKISLSDPELKFAVLKRTSQLLGLRIPDPGIDSVVKAGDLVEQLSRRPKAMKLEKEVGGDRIASKHKNLQWGVETQNDKDREHGSLKVIEEELRKVRLMTPEQRQWVLGE